MYGKYDLNLLYIKPIAINNTIHQRIKNTDNLLAIKRISLLYTLIYASLGFIAFSRPSVLISSLCYFSGFYIKKQLQLRSK